MPPARIAVRGEDMCVERGPKSELVIDRSLSSKRGVQVVLRLVPAGNSSCKGEERRAFKG